MKQRCINCYFREWLDRDTLDCIVGNGMMHAIDAKKINDCEEYTEAK